MGSPSRTLAALVASPVSAPLLKSAAVAAPPIDSPLPTSALAVLAGSLGEIAMCRPFCAIILGEIAMCRPFCAVILGAIAMCRPFCAMILDAIAMCRPELVTDFAVGVMSMPCVTVVAIISDTEVNVVGAVVELALVLVGIDIFGFRAGALASNDTLASTLTSLSASGGVFATVCGYFRNRVASAAVP